jgi:Flp pilus assembly protein TadG
MLEFALVLPILLLIIFGIIDFGRAFYLYNNLLNAAREGARAGAVMPIVGSEDAIRALVRGRIDDGAAASANVQVVYPPAPVNQRTVRVQIVDYPYNPVTPVVFNRTVNLRATAEFRHEFQ